MGVECYLTSAMPLGLISDKIFLWKEGHSAAIFPMSLGVYLMGRFYFVERMVCLVCRVTAEDAYIMNNRLARNQFYRIAFLGGFELSLTGNAY